MLGNIPQTLSLVKSAPPVKAIIDLSAGFMSNQKPKDLLAKRLKSTEFQQKTPQKAGKGASEAP